MTAQEGGIVREAFRLSNPARDERRPTRRRVRFVGATENGSRYGGRAMLLPDDFDVRFEPAPEGTIVRVTHLPTGNRRVRLASHGDKVRRVRESLIAELGEKLVCSDDVRIDIGRSTDGDFVRVTHVPSGLQRTALQRERSDRELLDEVLVELYRDPAKLRLVMEATDDRAVLPPEDRMATDG